MLWAPPASARVLYVNAAAKAQPVVDGSSWGRAFRDLQDALALAQPGDEIWIAAGTYRPDRGTGDRDMSFTVEGGVALYGGFSGRETAREQRNWVRNETVLSGDLNGDDGPQNCAAVSNCCVEHEGYSCDDAECESRVCNLDPDCCTQPDNPDNGWDEQCTHFAKLECCELGTWNSCENSRVIGRIPDGDGPAVMDGLRIVGSYDAVPIGEREAYSAAIDLGATSLTLRNCTLSDNARYGVNSLSDAPERSVTVENCRFARSIGDYALRLHNHQVSVSDSVFEDNNIAMSARSAMVSRCVFSNNRSRGLSLVGTGNVVEDSRFIGNVLAARMDGLGSSARVSRCYFIENENGLAVGSAVVSDCVFLDNLYEGLHCGGWATTDVRRCVIMGIGKGTEEGGRYGVSVQLGGLILRDSVVAGNRTWSGPGAVSVDAFSSAVIRNSLIADNHYSIRGNAGIWVRDSDVTLETSIVWGNSDRDGIAEHTQIGGIDATIAVNNSIVQDWSGVLGGLGNSGDDPLFVDPVGPDGSPGTGDENYRLSPNSPAIDAGDPDFVPYSGETDVDGFPRVLCGRVDIGAYEFGIGDSNCDHTVDLRDFSAWESCMTGPFEAGDGPWTQRYSPGCESFDSEYDGDVDLEDFSVIQNMGFQP